MNQDGKSKSLGLHNLTKLKHGSVNEKTWIKGLTGSKRAHKISPSDGDIRIVLDRI